MEEASKLHRDVPYGWVLVGGALWRFVARRRDRGETGGGKVKVKSARFGGGPSLRSGICRVLDVY